MPSGWPRDEGGGAIGTGLEGTGVVDVGVVGAGVVGAGTVDTGARGAEPGPGAGCCCAEGWQESFMRFTTLSDSFGKK